MADVFMCSEEKMKTMQTDLEEIQTIISEVHSLGQELLKQIESREDWEGQANKTGAAFLSLAVEFNRQLGSAEGGPVQEAYEGIKEYFDHEDLFYEEWEEFQEVKAFVWN